MKALVVAPQPFFTPRGTPMSVYYRTLITSQLGVGIDLLTYGEGQDVEIPGVRIIRIPNFSFLEPVKVGPSILKIFLDGFIILWTLWLLIRHRYDFVHAHEESVFFLRFFKPLFGFKLIYDMHSSLPQQLTNFKFTKSKVLIGIFKKLEDSCLKKADAVITICPELANYATQYISDSKKHFLIENSIFDEIKVARPTGEADSDDMSYPLPEGRPIIVYAGTFEPYQGLDILIESFSKVVKQNPQAFLLMIGGSEEQVMHYRHLAEQEGLVGDCHFTGRISQPATRHYISKAAVLTSPRKEGTNTPLKVYEQLASGIPLVATRILSHTQILTDTICMLVDLNAESMAEGILHALDNVEERQKITGAAKQLYETKYSRSVYEEKMKNLLQVIR